MFVKIYVPKSPLKDRRDLIRDYVDYCVQIKKERQSHRTFFYHKYERIILTECLLIQETFLTMIF